jgi:phage terminase small subunit
MSKRKAIPTPEQGAPQGAPSVRKGGTPPPGRGPSKGITPKQLRFVDEYMVDLNATQAAIRAGYSANMPGKIGNELLGKPNVAAEIDRRRAALRSNAEDRTRRNLSALDRLIEKAEALADAGDFKMADVLKAIEIQNDMLGLKNGGAAHEVEGDDSAIRVVRYTGMGA